VILFMPCWLCSLQDNQTGSCMCMHRAGMNASSVNPCLTRHNINSSCKQLHFGRLCDKQVQQENLTPVNCCAKLAACLRQTSRVPLINAACTATSGLILGVCPVYICT
jgi:hypothetical protein